MAVVAVVAIIAGVTAVRNAAVVAFADSRPALAASVWADHPRTVTAVALGAIGRTTAEGQAPGAATLQALAAVLRQDPLAAEPLLVEGTKALSAGQFGRAEALLVEARRRDPRLPAARYLLADLYLRQGRTADGLREIGALIRRLPKAAAPLTPALAAFARQPGAAGQVREIIDGNPQLRNNVLATLAADPGNTALVLSLAGDTESEGEEAWRPVLLASLLQSGEYRRAYRLWARFSGVRPDVKPGLFNSRFRFSRALPPFNWTLTSGAAGVAEPAPDGGLRVLFYGRENAVLASQVLLLTPGTYRLRYELRSAPADGAPLGWAVHCLPGDKVLAAQTSIDDGALPFAVPASCRAQELQLRGSVAEFPASVDLTIDKLGLTREGAR